MIQNKDIIVQKAIVSDVPKFEKLGIQEEKHIRFLQNKDEKVLSNTLKHCLEKVVLLNVILQEIVL